MVAVGLRELREDGPKVLVVLVHAGPHGLSRSARRGPYVHGQHQRHLIALPRVASGSEMLAVERHVLAKLRQGRGGRAGVDRQPEIADVRETLRRVNGDADRGVGPLQRLGHHGDILHVMESAAIAEALLRPRQTDDLERLVEACAVLGHGHTEAVELAGDRAPAHSEFQTPTGEQVGRGRLLGAAQRMVEGEQGDGGPDADALRALGDQRHQHERSRQERERAAEVQLRQPGHVEAQRVGERDEIEHLGVALGVRLPDRFGSLEEETEPRGVVRRRRPDPPRSARDTARPGRTARRCRSLPSRH